ncbi:hypothetical protein WN944_023062 [Citrus x changshan-huyou]|uniref:Uncharacterized protein n=1 Tax=Citrus x changshan-huyou TaxID=2935761 RepID=A0AAP0MZG5_9ROSI
MLRSSRKILDWSRNQNSFRCLLKVEIFGALSFQVNVVSITIGVRKDSGVSLVRRVCIYIEQVNKMGA